MADGTEAAASRFSYHSGFACHCCLPECLEFPREGKRNRKIQTKGDAYSDTDSCPGSHRDPNANADINIDGYADPHADFDIDCHADANTHVHVDTDIDFNAGSRLRNQLAWQ